MGVADVDRAVGVRRTVVQHELLVTLVLLQNLLVDLVVLPVLESLGLGLERPARMGKPVLGRFIVCLYSFATVPLSCRGRARPLGTKKRPSLQAGTKRHKTGCAPAKALRLTTQLRCPRPRIRALASVTRLACIDDHLGDVY